jgi:hypothetical protein
MGFASRPVHVTCLCTALLNAEFKETYGRKSPARLASEFVFKLSVQPRLMAQRRGGFTHTKPKQAALK